MTPVTRVAELHAELRVIIAEIRAGVTPEIPGDLRALAEEACRPSSNTESIEDWAHRLASDLVSTENS